MCLVHNPVNKRCNQCISWAAVDHYIPDMTICVHQLDIAHSMDVCHTIWNCTYDDFSPKSVESDLTRLYNCCQLTIDSPVITTFGISVNNVSQKKLGHLQISERGLLMGYFRHVMIFYFKDHLIQAMMAVIKANDDNGTPPDSHCPALMSKQLLRWLKCQHMLCLLGLIFWQNLWRAKRSS